MVFFFYVGGGPRAILLSVGISVLSMMLNSNTFFFNGGYGADTPRPVWEDTPSPRAGPRRGQRRQSGHDQRRDLVPAGHRESSTGSFFVLVLFALVVGFGAYGSWLLNNPRQAQSLFQRKLLLLSEKVYDFMLHLGTEAARFQQQWGDAAAGGEGAAQRKKATQQEVTALPIEAFAGQADLLRWSPSQLKDDLRRLQIMADMQMGRFSGGTAARETHHFLRAGGAVEKQELVAAVMKARGGESGLSCAICLATYTCSEKVRVLPCGHRFHCGCIDRWLLEQSRTCPLCSKGI